MQIAERMHSIQPFHVMALLARARELEAAGRSIVHMEIGEPDFVTPQPVVDAGKAALSAGHTHYTPATGLPALRERIAGFYHERYGIEVEPGRIVVTPGASAALQLVMAMLVNPGDRLLLADPGYPCNRNFVYLLNGQPVGLPVGPDTAYQPAPQQVAANWDEATRALLVAGFGVVLFSLVVQGLTFMPLLDFLGLSGAKDEEDEDEGPCEEVVI